MLGQSLGGRSLIGEFSELQLQFRLILRVAGKIWQIRRIFAVIRRILQIPRGTANSKTNIEKKNLQKSVAKKSYNLPLSSYFRI